MPIENGFKPERLREAMAARGMNQKQLAAAAGLTPTAVSHYLNGERDPRTAALASIARALDTNPADLIGDWSHIDATSIATLDAAVRLVAERVADLSDARRATLAVALVAPGADVEA